jgi:hypothetical protein
MLTPSCQQGRLETGAQVKVVEVTRDGRTIGCGQQRFISLPSSGDQFVHADEAGNLRLMCVLYVEHHIARLPSHAERCALNASGATIYAKIEVCRLD